MLKISIRIIVQYIFIASTILFGCNKLTAEKPPAEIPCRIDLEEFNLPAGSILRFQYLKTLQPPQSDSVSITDSGFRLLRITAIESDSFAFITSDSSTFVSDSVGTAPPLISQGHEIRQSFGVMHEPQYILSGCLEDLDTSEWTSSNHAISARYASAEIDSEGMLVFDIVGNVGLRGGFRISSRYVRGEGLVQYDKTATSAPIWEKNRYALIRAD